MIKYTWQDIKTKKEFNLFSIYQNFNLAETYEETFKEWAGGKIIKRVKHS